MNFLPLKTTQQASSNDNEQQSLSKNINSPSTASTVSMKDDLRYEEGYMDGRYLRVFEDGTFEEIEFPANQEGFREMSPKVVESIKRKHEGSSSDEINNPPKKNYQRFYPEQFDYLQPRNGTQPIPLNPDTYLQSPSRLSQSQSRESIILQQVSNHPPHASTSSTSIVNNCTDKKEWDVVKDEEFVEMKSFTIPGTGIKPVQKNFLWKFGREDGQYRVVLGHNTLFKPKKDTSIDPATGEKQRSKWRVIRMENIFREKITPLLNSLQDTSPN